MPKPVAIFLDSGHGKGILGIQDNGASGTLSSMKYTERDYVVDLGRRIYALLRPKPELAGVSMFGVGIETRMSCSEKVQFIKNIIAERKYDPRQCIMISLHTNAGGGHGSEIWTPTQFTGATKALADHLIASFTSYEDFLPRSPAIKPSSQDRFGKLYIDDIPYATWVLVESFFIDNAADLGHALNIKDRLTEQICHGILEYVRS